MDRSEFGEMLAIFDRWIATQEASGWPSPEVEKHASRVRNGLWACSKNPHHILTAGLATATEELARARAAADAHRSSAHRH